MCAHSAQLLGNATRRQIGVALARLSTMPLRNAVLVSLLVFACSEPDGANQGSPDENADVAAESSETIRFGETKTGSFVVDLEAHEYVFETFAGAEVSVTAQPELGTDLKLQAIMYNPARSRIATSSSVADSVSIERTVLPADGTYSVVIVPVDRFSRGSYNVTLKCDNDACDAGAPTVKVCEDAFPAGTGVSGSARECSQHVADSEDDPKVMISACVEVFSRDSDRLRCIGTAATAAFDMVGSIFACDSQFSDVGREHMCLEVAAVATSDPFELIFDCQVSTNNEDEHLDCIRRGIV